MWPFLQTTSNTCGCEQSDYNQCGCNKTSSNDISYNGPALVCTEIALCDSLTVALQKIETKICSAGTVSGTGINDYIARWTPDNNTLSVGLIRDNGLSTGINIAPGADTLLKMYTTSHSFGNYAINTRVSNDDNIGIKGVALSSTNINIGVQGIGANKDNVVNIGVNGIGQGNNDDAGTAMTIGGKFEAYDTNLSNSYAVQLYDGSQGVGKFLKSITADGHANWANITASDVSGVVEGSGTTNYVARWTPNGTTLGIGLIRDNNTSLGINTPAVTDRLISAVSSTHRVGNYINIASTFSAGETAIATISAANGTNTGGETIGLLASATGSTVVNKGVESTAVQITSAENIGGRFEANNSSSANYAIQLQDGTEAVDKVLTSVTATGKANWNKVTSDYTTGATGTFTSQDGKTITVTNGLITSIV